MNTDLIQKCTADTFAGVMTFGEIVTHMLEEGVEWYSANLIFGMTTYYAADGYHFQVKWPEFGRGTIANAFDETRVMDAIRASQKREILYPEFLRQAAAAGVVYYTVHLQGRQALYFGRHGHFHREPFPQAKS